MDKDSIKYYSSTESTFKIIQLLLYLSHSADTKFTRHNYVKIPKLHA